MPIYSIRHKTQYIYAEPVAASLNQARLRPRDMSGQRLLNFSLTATPDFEDYHEGPDFFGNSTSFFQMQKKHKIFEVTATSRVDVTWSENDSPPDSPAWEDAAAMLANPVTPELQTAVGFCIDSPMVKPFSDLRDYTLRSFSPGRKLGEATLGLMFRIHRDFRFRPGSTNVSTTLETVFQTRSGVCQDFSHLMIGCLRSVGLAARYVSGYLETLPPPGKKKLQGADASHAWVSVFIPDKGWVDFDPTNRMLPGPRHITVAWGRDFSDVSPLRGVLYGGGGQKLKVEVDVNSDEALRAQEELELKLAAAKALEVKGEGIADSKSPPKTEAQKPKD